MLNRSIRFSVLILSLVGVMVCVSPALAKDKVKLRMSTPASATDQRCIALAKVFGPAVADFSVYEPHYNASLIAQGSELESIASGDLEMSITSARNWRPSSLNFPSLPPVTSIRTRLINCAFSTIH